MIVTCDKCVRPGNFCPYSAGRNRVAQSSCQYGINQNSLMMVDCAEICGHCSGACCHKDRTHLLPKSYLDLYDLPNENGHCPAFDHNIGCVLPRAGRPIICLDFACSLIEAVQSDDEMWQHCQKYGQFSEQASLNITCKDCPHWSKCKYRFRLVAEDLKDQV